MPKQTDFLIPKDGYLSFDALTLKQFIKDRLNETNIFTDQNYEGSYIATFNEIQAYTIHVLMYYLNRTSTEGQFSEAQIYENINRIVKLIDYKPIGKQTSTLTFNMSAGTEFNTGVYTIPRYSYIENGMQTYSFNEDIVFAKTIAAGTIQSLEDVSKEKLLYQGRYKEYTAYTAVGNDNEIIYFAPGDNVIVDHFNIDVYVNQDGKWIQWKQTNSLYLEDAFSSSFEMRFNENKQYEIKFGNNINGKKLNVNDIVAIYYLESQGTNGEVGPHAIQGRNIIPFSTIQYNEILSSVNVQSNNEFTYITTTQTRNLLIDNDNISTYYQTEEDVESIRNNAPGIYRSQYRLITEQDYTNYIKTNFANLIHDVKVVNNWAYVSEQLKYYYTDIGLKDPNNVSNILYNQLNFADSCNFNNVYLTIVPKTITNTKNPTSNLTPAQKELILSSIRSVKTLTSETVILDPVYIACDICMTLDGSAQGNLSDIDKTQIMIIKTPSSRRDDNSIIVDVASVFTDYFSRASQHLGNDLELNTITNNILSIDGVRTFYTQRTDNSSIKYQGLSMLTWNPVYPTDKVLTTKNTTNAYFKYLYLNNNEYLTTKIKVNTDTKIYETIEY
jgi:hypothetical protein